MVPMMIVANDNTFYVREDGIAIVNAGLRTTRGTNTPLTGSVSSRPACLGYTNARHKHFEGKGIKGFTYCLQEQRRGVENKQYHIQDVEDRFDRGQHRRPSFDA